jgi:hypothetical protein
MTQRIPKWFDPEDLVERSDQLVLLLVVEFPQPQHRQPSDMPGTMVFGDIVEMDDVGSQKISRDHAASRTITFVFDH